MNYTTNYNLNKPEGTDLYNHLTIDNPNMDTIDSVMHANKLQAIGAATELVSGTVHAITRSDSDQNIFKFKATGNFSTGDTITVDGVSVNAYTTGGQPLTNDAYVLSAEVICILDGTSLWVLVNNVPTSSEIEYAPGMNINDAVQQVINRMVSVYLSFDAINNNFPIPAGYTKPLYQQLCVPARNMNNGAYYILFYNGTDAFNVGAVISGSAPSNGDGVSISYCRGL